MFLSHPVVPASPHAAVLTVQNDGEGGLGGEAAFDVLDRFSCGVKWSTVTFDWFKELMMQLVGLDNA